MQQTPADNLQQLAAQRGGMYWLGAFGRIPSAKVSLGAVCLMMLALLSASAALVFRQIFGDYAVLSLNLSLVCLFFAFGLLRRRGKLEKRRQEAWRYDAAKRTLHWLDKGRQVAEYALSDRDTLMAGEHEFHGEPAWVVAYRRPYPKQEVIVFAYLYGRKQDKAAFIDAAQNMAANMGLPLEQSWRGGSGRLKREKHTPQEQA